MFVKLIEKINVLKFSLITYHETVVKFKHDIIQIPYYNIEYIFTFFWIVGTITATCARGQMFGKAILSFGAPYFLPTLKLVAFICYICLYYVEYRRFVFICTTKNYSKNMKIYMFIRRIIKNFIILGGMLCIIDLHLLYLDLPPQDGDINYYRIINYKNFRGKF